MNVTLFNLNFLFKGCCKVIPLENEYDGLTEESLNELDKLKIDNDIKLRIILKKLLETNKFTGGIINKYEAGNICHSIMIGVNMSEPKNNNTIVVPLVDTVRVLGSIVLISDKKIKDYVVHNNIIEKIKELMHT